MSVSNSSVKAAKSLESQLNFIDSDAQFFPAASNRSAWQKLINAPASAAEVRNVIKTAESLIRQPIPPLTAGMYIEYRRSGRRKDYETPFFQRAQMLKTFAFAEALEYKGRFIDPVIDCLWEILNEPTWTVPAHIHMHPDAVSGKCAGDPLPPDSGEWIDLFSAERSALISCVLRLHREKLLEISPNLVQRTENILFERVINALDNGTDTIPCWWQNGFNNWSVWCASNLFGPVHYLLAKSDPARCLDLIRKLTGVIDRYIGNFCEDGGCNEGPGYYLVSPAKLCWALEQIYVLSGGKINGFKLPKVKRMAEYIADAFLGGNNFATFYDCPQYVMDKKNPLIYHFGQRIGSEKLMAFANRSDKLRRGNKRLNSAESALYELFFMSDMPEARNKDVEHNAYYPVLQQFFIRTKKFGFAAKGGFNMEGGHNHNDIGQFILTAMNKPFIIDFGRPEYTRFVFNESRYNIWEINSLSHNVPLINGVQQGTGKEFTASGVNFGSDGDIFEFSMELSGAYPAEAKVKRYTRYFRIDRKKSVISVNDSWETVPGSTLEIPFYTPASVEKTDNGFLLLNGKAKVKCCISGENVTARAGIQQLSDNETVANWGKQINSIIVTSSAPEGKFSLEFYI